jgi:hypothetical protein
MDVEATTKGVVIAWIVVVEEVGCIVDEEEIADEEEEEVEVEEVVEVAVGGEKESETAIGTIRPRWRPTRPPW